MFPCFLQRIEAAWVLQLVRDPFLSLQIQHDGMLNSLTLAFYFHCHISFWLWSFFLFLFLKDFVYSLLETGEWRKKERERNINVWLPLANTPNQGPCPQPRHVPWLGIDPVTPGSQAGAQSTVTHQPGTSFFFLIFNFFNWIYWDDTS